MEMIMKINGFINGIVWGPPILILIVGTGIYFTVRTNCFSIFKLGYVLKNRNEFALYVYGFVYSDTNLFESVEIVNEIVKWCDHSFKRRTDRHYNEYGTRYIGEQLVEAVNRWKAHDIQEACKNCLRDLTKDQVKHIQEISMKLDAMLNENNDCTTKEQLESEKELIDKVLERINEKLSIISM